MQLSTTTLAWSRNVLSAVLGGITTAGALHFLTPSDVTSLTNGVTQVATGLGQVYNGVLAIAAILSPIAAALTAWWASRAATKAADPITQATALVKNVPGTTVVTSPALAASIPDVQAIVSNTEKAVVTK